MHWQARETRRWIKVGLTFVQRRDGGQMLNAHWFNVSLCQLSIVYASGTDCPYSLYRQTRIPLDNHMQPALFQCWHTVYDAGPTFGQCCRIRPTINDRCTSQQTRDVDPMLFQCRADVRDGGPTFKQHWSIVGHVSYTVLEAWYCEAGQSTEGQSVLLRSHNRHCTW